MPCKPRLLRGVKGHNQNEISFPGSAALWAGSFKIGRKNPDHSKQVLICKILFNLLLRAPGGCVPARRSACFRRNASCRQALRHAGVAIRRSRCEGLARGNLKSSLALPCTPCGAGFCSGQGFISFAMTLSSVYF